MARPVLQKLTKLVRREYAFTPEMPEEFELRDQLERSYMDRFQMELFNRKGYVIQMHRDFGAANYTFTFEYELGRLGVRG